MERESIQGSVLLVEPDDRARSRFEGMLTSAGWEVVASDGSKPLPRQKSEEPLVILVSGGGSREDFDELQFIRQVRENPATETAPLVLLAARADHGTSVAALKEGADDIASEPFTEERLRTRVQAHFSLARLRREEGEIAPRAFDQLRLSERRLRSLIHATATMVWNAAGDGRIVEETPMWEKFTGQAWDDYREMGWLAAVHPDDRDQVREKWQEGIAGTRHFSAEIRLRHHDGHYRIVRFQAVPIPGHPGGHERIREWVAMVEDITETRRAEEALRESEQRLRLIMESSTDFAIFTMDLQGNITTWNAGARQLLGYSDEEILGTDFRRLFIKKDIEAGAPDEELTNALETGRGADKRWHKRKDGSRFWADGLVMPLRTREGDTCGYLKIIRDFTEQKKAMDDLKDLTKELDHRVQERTKQLEESRSRLRSLVFELNKAEQMERQRIAAELHDSLAQLLTAAQLSLRAATREVGEMPAAASLKQVQEIIAEATSTTRGLMTELSGPQVLEHDDLVVTLRWVVEKMRGQDLSIRFTYNKPQIPLERDLLTLLFQAVRELLLNAAKHSGVREAAVHIEHSPQKLEVTVSDEGEGFEPSKMLGRPGCDGGFGLLNIQERLRWLGGGLKIESARGQGVRATLQVPLAEKTMPVTEYASPPTNSKSKTPKMAEGEKPISVLLADDHRMVREGFRRIIEEKPDLLIIGEAADGVEAVEKALDLLPDVVVMDLNMPRMNGLEATRRLRRELPGITVIGLSLHSQRDVAESVKEAGAVAYISKEEACETLCEIIRSEFHKHTLQAG